MTVEELRAQKIEEIAGKSWWGGTRFYSDLSAQDQSLVTDAMAAYIAAHPTEFSVGTEAAAKRWNSSGVVGLPYADTSLSAAAGTFVDEVGNQAVKLNPLSEANRGKTFLLLAVVVLVYLFGPAILKGLTTSVEK
jgi:hypothetical protein